MASDTAALAAASGGAGAKQPGVAGVVGPATVPAAEAKAGVPAAARASLPNPMLAKSGNAARFGVIERTDPLGPTAVSDARIAAGQAASTGPVRWPGRRARSRSAARPRRSARPSTATTASLAELALIMLAITFVLLALFLRALLAPLYLLAASVLALLATLGVTVWIFQHRLGYDGLVYYVPFTVAVLLISLGADYNVFVVGRIWEEARRRPLREAIAVAGSQASRAITVAGVALATSFALLALIPLQQFREVAVAMAAGIVIDAIVARSLLVPALVALFGRAGMWPGRRTPAAAPRRSGGSPVAAAQPWPYGGGAAAVDVAFRWTDAPAVDAGLADGGGSVATAQPGSDHSPGAGWRDLHRPSGRSASRMSASASAGAAACWSLLK